MNESKADLRRCMNKLRTAQTADEIDEKSYAICEHIIRSTEFQSASVVLLYSALGSEVRLDRLIDYSCKHGKEVLLPVCGQGNTMYAYRVMPGTSLISGKYGIAEPDAAVCPQVSPDRIDYIAVPGVAFDRDMNRLGRGAGYYDEFLPQARNAVKVGIGYEAQIIDKVPTRAEDYRMDMLVCERGTIRGDVK